MTQAVPQRIRRLSERAIDPIWPSILGGGGGITETAVARSGSISGFPSTGRQPVSSAGFVLDLRDNSIAGVSLAKQQVFAAFNAGADVQGLFNSLVFLADDDVAVESWPGYQGWQADSCAVYSIPIRGLAWIKVSGARSFVFQLIFSSQDEPVMALPVTYHQERWATQTLTKTAAAGVADGWTAVDFTASDGSTQLDPATYGSSTIHVGNIGAKNFITTAVGNDINILIEGLNVSGKTWAADPTTSSAGVTLADGDVSNAQSVRYYHVVRMRARVDAAVAATGTSAITSQFRGMAGAF
jgi:hypothetical protein